MKGNCGIALMTETVHKPRMLLLSPSELWLWPGVLAVLDFYKVYIVSSRCDLSLSQLLYDRGVSGVYLEGVWCVLEYYN